MKKIVSVVITLLALCCLLSISAAAETTIQTPAIASASLSFNGNVHMYFNVYFGETAPTTEDYGVIFWTEEQAAANYTYEKATAEGAPASIVTGANADDVVYKDHPCKVFRYSVDAKCMTDMVYAQGYMKDGDTYSYSKVVPYSVQTYAGRKLGIYPNVAQDNISTNQDFINMIKALLDYGAAAQINFDYRTDDLANTILKWSRGLEYRSNGDGTCYVNRIGTCTDTELYIPKVALDGECAGMKVTSIGDYAFCYCSSLTSMTIPDSVTSIGEEAFRGCSSLTSITIPNSVTSIGLNAFYKTAYYNNNANWENGVLYIGNHLIKANTSVTGSYTIKSSTKCIADRAFYDCSELTSIMIPEGVTSIGNYAFRGCSSLTSITIPDSVTSIGGWAFSSCSRLTSITIPEGVTSIDGGAFSGCSRLTSITIPDGVTSIGNDAFSYCSRLTSITIPDSVTSIGERAFSDCSSLTSITIPDSVTSIGDEAFYYCSSLYVVRNNSALDIKLGNSNNGYVAYYAKIVIDANGNMTSVDDGSEYILSEDSFLFQEKSGKYYLLAYTGTESTITLPRSIEGSKYEISNMRGVVNVIIPEGVTSIGNEAFYNCRRLTSITIPDSVTSIGNSVFYNCSSLTSITIPNSVTKIGSSAFNGCSNLEKVYITDVAKWCDIQFGTDGGYDANPLYYAHELYLNGVLVTDLVVPDGVTSIAANAFKSCTSLVSVTIPSSVKSIGVAAFHSCSSITDITFKGTKAEWEAITKADGWNNRTGSYTIHCTDGDISK